MLDFYAKVIEILDEYSIIINYGRNDGAREGGEVRIIAIGPEIKDPSTGETLGTLDSVKETLTIETVYDQFSICKKIKIKVTNDLISPLSQFQSTSRTIGALKVKEDEISHKKTPNDTIIRIGDIVEIL